ncbi:hypothetical protein BJV82DRAFT_591616 [Fennellomyces sp. T-0311]|nr:hypothetical protein BJV82DRAFT_591616 [Fennellomyces sp. T-0311]
MPCFAYTTLLVLFGTSYAFNLASLVLPKWLTLTTADATYSYGLFQVCQSDTHACRPFPRSSQADCTEDLCPLWQAAGAGMILASVAGALTIVAMVGTMCSNRRKRERGWKLVSGMLVLHAVPSAVAVLIMAHLSAKVLHFATPDVAFFLSIAGWCLSLLLALALTYFSGSSHHHYEALD